MIPFFARHCKFVWGVKFQTKENNWTHNLCQKLYTPKQIVGRVEERNPTWHYQKSGFVPQPNLQYVILSYRNGITMLFYQTTKKGFSYKLYIG